MEASASGRARAIGASAPGDSDSNRRAEYLLVIYPGGDLQDKLLEEQQQFSNEYSVSVRNKPHITVAAFQALAARVAA